MSASASGLRQDPFLLAAGVRSASPAASNMFRNLLSGS